MSWPSRITLGGGAGGGAGGRADVELAAARRTGRMRGVGARGSTLIATAGCGQVGFVGKPTNPT